MGLADERAEAAAARESRAHAAALVARLLETSLTQEQRTLVLLHAAALHIAMCAGEHDHATACFAAALPGAVEYWAAIVDAQDDARQAGAARRRAN